MEIPRVLRAQLKEYEKAGFHAVRIEPRAGSHFKVWYAELPDKPQIITKNANSLNAIAYFNLGVIGGLRHQYNAALANYQSAPSRQR